MRALSNVCHLAEGLHDAWCLRIVVEPHVVGVASAEVEVGARVDAIDIAVELARLRDHFVFVFVEALNREVLVRDDANRRALTSHNDRAEFHGLRGLLATNLHDGSAVTYLRLRRGLRQLVRCLVMRAFLVAFHPPDLNTLPGPP